MQPLPTPIPTSRSRCPAAPFLSISGLFTNQDWAAADTGGQASSASSNSAPPASRAASANVRCSGGRCGPGVAPELPGIRGREPTHGLAHDLLLSRSSVRRRTVFELIGRGLPLRGPTLLKPALPTALVDSPPSEELARLGTVFGLGGHEPTLGPRQSVARYVISAAGFFRRVCPGPDALGRAAMSKASPCAAQ